MIELDEIRLPTLSKRETLELQTEVLSEPALEGSARRAGAVCCERLAHRAGADRCILFAREFRASGDWTVIARSDSNDAEGIETVCFRIAQEALTNTMRHATAKKAFIRLRSDATYLQLSVGDDGHGFDVEQRLRDARWGHSFGLAGMHERASLLGGERKIVSNPRGGTVIHASLPY